jgi:ketosteroid isomerase-like protein
MGTIEQAIFSFIRAYNTGDIAGVLKCYSDDLIKLRHGAPVETKPEVAARLAAVFAQFQTHIEVVIEEIQETGEIAFSLGSFRVMLVPKEVGEAQAVARRYFELWRKESGQWVVFRTMDNEN